MSVPGLQLSAAGARRVSARLGRAAGASCCVYAAKTLCALSATLPIVGAVGTPSPASGERAVDSMLSLWRLSEYLGSHGPRLSVWSLLATLATAPFLLPFWLNALRQPGRLLVHAELAAGKYRRALVVHLGGLALQAALLLLAAGSALGTWRLLGAEFDPRSSLLGAVFAGLPFAAGALHVATWSDLAQLELVRNAADRRKLRVLLQRAHAATGFNLLVVRCALATATVLVSLAALAVPRLIFGVDESATTAAIGASQLAAALLVALRGGWLALLIERSPEPAEQPDRAARADNAPAA